jgi:diaminopimelate epimerase
MCGNGGRCLAHFANFLGLGDNGNMEFIAVDGPHKAAVHGELVALQMRDVKTWQQRDEMTWTADTGSPHYVRFMDEDIRQFDLVPFAKNVRYSDEYRINGINVNIVQKLGNDEIGIRTYERGVEDETLSCGTGVTAAALIFQLSEGTGIPVVKVRTEGGNLEVLSRKQGDGFSDIVLRGPAVMVYSGNI